MSILVREKEPCYMYLKNWKSYIYFFTLLTHLAYELWSDIKIRILRESVDYKPALTYIIRLNLWWQLFNFACAIILRCLYNFITPSESIGHNK